MAFLLFVASLASHGPVRLSLRLAWLVMLSLPLPTHLVQALTLGQVREAYRQMALSHHPDAGGSAEAMRRINEAYQSLKEPCRQHDRAQQA